MKTILQIFESASSSTQFTVNVKTLQNMLNKEAAFYKNFKKFSDDEAKVIFNYFKSRFDTVSDETDEQFTFYGESLFQNIYHALNSIVNGLGNELFNRFLFIKCSLEVFNFSGIYDELRTKGYEFHTIGSPIDWHYQQWYEMSIILKYKLDTSKLPDTGIGKPLKWKRILTLLDKMYYQNVKKEIIDKYIEYGEKKGYDPSTVIKQNDFLQLVEDSYIFTKELSKETGNEKYLNGGLAYNDFFDILCDFYKPGTQKFQPQVFSYLTPVLYEMYKSGKIESFALELIDKNRVARATIF